MRRNKKRSSIRASRGSSYGKPDKRQRKMDEYSVHSQRSTLERSSVETNLSPDGSVDIPPIQNSTQEKATTKRIDEQCSPLADRSNVENMETNLSQDGSVYMSSSLPNSSQEETTQKQPDDTMNLTFDFPKQGIHPPLRDTTDGKESVLEIVKRIISERYPNKSLLFDYMTVKSKSDDSYINIGSPAGALSSDDTYICMFPQKEAKYKTSEYCRHYNCKRFDRKTCQLDFFYINMREEGRPRKSISPFQTLRGLVRVHYTPEETLFEAIARDGRFGSVENDGSLSIAVIRKLSVVDDKSTVDLKSRARDLEIDSNILKVTVRSFATRSLPEVVKPLLYPVIKRTTKRRSTEMSAADCSPYKHRKSSASPERDDLTSTSTESKLYDKEAKNCSIHNVPAFEQYIENEFGFKARKQAKRQAERRRQRDIDKLCNTHGYENFALECQDFMYIKDHEWIASVSKSVGAIFAFDSGKVPRLQGTCFRIGPQHIMTNNHVVKLVEKLTSGDVTKAFVDFDFEEGEKPYGKRFYIADIFLRSESLDYAILTVDVSMTVDGAGEVPKVLPMAVDEPMSPTLIEDVPKILPMAVDEPMSPTLTGNQPNSLPPSIFSHGISICHPNCGQLNGKIVLIGHPNGDPKKTNLFCPIIPKSQEEAHNKLYLASLFREGNRSKAGKICEEYFDTTRVEYHVTDFFHASSGSPVILHGTNYLIALHTGGFPFHDKKKTILEQGVLMAKIAEDVHSRIKGFANRPHFEDFFPNETNS